MVQWLRIHLPMQGMWIQSLVGKLRSHMPQGNWASAPQLERRHAPWEAHVPEQKNPHAATRPGVSKYFFKLFVLILKKKKTVIFKIWALIVCKFIKLIILIILIEIILIETSESISQRFLLSTVLMCNHDACSGEIRAVTPPCLSPTLLHSRVAEVPREPHSYNVSISRHSHVECEWEHSKCCQ